MRPISLEPLTIMTVPAPEFVDIAADLGCAEVALWVNLPYPGLEAPLLSAHSALLPTTLQKLQSRGLGVPTTECFNLSATFDCAAAGPALDVAASLGARAVTAVFLDDIDPGLAERKFVEFCQAAGGRGLNATIEFLTISPLASSLAKTLAFIEKTAQPNARVTIDFLHLVRTGGTVEELAGLDPALIGHVQICDGPLRAPQDPLFEMGENRMIPGTGEFPLVDFLRCIPPEIPIGVEVPRKEDADHGVSPFEIARRCVEATKRILTIADGATRQITAVA